MACYTITLRFWTAVFLFMIFIINLISSSAADKGKLILSSSKTQTMTFYTFDMGLTISDADQPMPHRDLHSLEIIEEEKEEEEKSVDLCCFSVSQG